MSYVFTPAAHPRVKAIQAQVAHSDAHILSVLLLALLFNVESMAVLMVRVNMRRKRLFSIPGAPG